VFGFEDEIVFVDIETTGFEPERDGIIEIAALVARGPEVIDRFHTMVDPGRAVPPEITKLTGIDDAMLLGAPGPEVAATRFAEFAAGRDIVAHNVAFDRGFLTRVAGEHRFRGAWIDSLQLAVIALPRLKSHRLADLSKAFSIGRPTHRATDDAEALAGLWRVFLCALEQLPAALLGRIVQLAPETNWPLRSVFAHMAAGTQAATFDLTDTRRQRVSADRAEALCDAGDVECRCPPPDEVSAEFSENGLAGRMYASFEHRDEQERMARAVLEAFASGSHAAIEAGTGVGKSLAYLVPAAQFAMLNGIGVGVATKTNSLTDQLVHSELPALCRALDGELRYVSLKGYDHYPCLRKLERFAADLDGGSELALVTVAALFAWTAQSTWGDLDAINVHWRRETRTQVAASVADCTHKRCRFYPNLCYLHGVRRRADSAHIVVTNHALLFRDVVASGGILPPLRHWIVDEAHAVESEARKQLTLEASHVEMAALLSALHGSGKSGLLDGVRRKIRTSPPDTTGEILSALSRTEEHCTTAATLVGSLFDFVKDLDTLVAEGTYDSCEARIDLKLRSTGAWSTVAGVGTSLARRLAEVLEAGKMLVTLLEEAGPVFADARADLSGLLTRLADQLEGLRIVLDGEAEEFLYYLALDRRRNVIAERLVAARLDIGEVLAEEFYPRTRSVVFTSATIATGDDFSHFVRVAGLDRLEDTPFATHRLDSSYDFDRQMAVFVPNDLPIPGSREYLSALESLLFDVHVAMGGATLTLFTNRREMEALYRALAPRLEAEGISLLVQGHGVSTKRLRDEFLADERLSLFATKSFWEGFDAKGDTLRCVVIPKLPFSRPNDPLAEERKNREGQVAWRRYALPEAILELKQAAGRLIRASTDSGCLVLADVRLLTKSYGRDFLGSLPVADVEVLSSENVVREIGDRFSHDVRRENLGAPEPG
jgi:ATP-dependent DNA helicase DinG